MIIKLVPMIREIIEQLRAAKQDDGKVTPDEIADALLAGCAVALDEIARAGRQALMVIDERTGAVEDSIRSVSATVQCTTCGSACSRIRATASRHCLSRYATRCGRIAAASTGSPKPSSMGSR